MKIETLSLGSYLLTIDIPLSGNDVLRSGEQIWYLQISWLGYGDYFVPEQMKHQSKMELAKDLSYKNDEYADKIVEMRATAYWETFNSPKDIPIEYRTAYMDDQRTCRIYDQRPQFTGGFGLPLRSGFPLLSFLNDQLVDFTQCLQR